MSGGVHLATVLLPRHPPCVFPLHWRAFRQRAGIWFRSPNFSGKTVDFAVLFLYFCHRFAVHFPYDCRPFSVIALPLDSAVLGASARKSQCFQESSGSFPYIFHAFSMRFPYFFRPLAILFPSTCHTFSVRYLTGWRDPSFAKHLPPCLRPQSPLVSAP